MDRIADWRPIETSGPGGTAADAPVSATDESTRWRLVALAALGCAGVGAVAVALWAGSPQPELVLAGAASPSPAISASAPSASAAVGSILVDIEGAVSRPGLYMLRAASRVGDAIAAAGGYSPAVDIDAAAQQLNLAAPLSDGDKIIVPRLGQAAEASAPPSATAPATTGGLIDINRADQPTLETLPGIGPVTAAKIIAAREAAPFSAVDELLSRGVLGPATFDKVKPLVTVGP
jgi:competence protein ComEA